MEMVIFKMDKFKGHPQAMIAALLIETDPENLDYLTKWLAKEIDDLDVDSVWKLVARDECLALVVWLLSKLEPEGWIHRIDEGFVKRLAKFLNRGRRFPYDIAENDLWSFERWESQAAARALVQIYNAGGHKNLIFSYNGAEVISADRGFGSHGSDDQMFINDPPEIFCVDQDYMTLMIKKYGETAVNDWDLDNVLIQREWMKKINEN